MPLGGGLLAGGGPTGVANAVGGVGSPGGALPILGGCPLDAEPGGGTPGGGTPGGRTPGGAEPGGGMPGSIMPGGGMPGGAIPGGGMPGGAIPGGGMPGGATWYVTTTSGAVLLIVGG